LKNAYVYQGGSIKLRITWRTHPRPGDTNPDTKKGVLVNPTSQTWQIKDPSGTVMITIHDTDVIQRESLGIYYYDYSASASATVGTWTCVGLAMIRGLPAVKVIEFDVKAA
jgi:hypothetical protein